MKKKPIYFYCWIMLGGRVGYQTWQEFCCVWFELVCHKCLGQSGEERWKFFFLILDASEGTDTQTHATNRHCDSMVESA